MAFLLLYSLCYKRSKLTAAAGLRARLVDSAGDLLDGEETHVADPLREYVLYGDALKSLVQRHEGLLCDLERAQAAVEGKEKEISQVRKPEGVMGFFSSMRSTTEQEKDIKIGHLTQQLTTLKQTADTEQEEFMCVCACMRMCM
jgi:hypothetical protein